MKKLIAIVPILATILIFGLAVNSCTTAKVAMKSGAQLWGENCLRCHNAPPPDQFSDSDWNVIGTHMEITADLTQDEATKIFEFLKSAN